MASWGFWNFFGKREEAETRLQRALADAVDSVKVTFERADGTQVIWRRSVLDKEAAAAARRAYMLWPSDVQALLATAATTVQVTQKDQEDYQRHLENARRLTERVALHLAQQGNVDASMRGAGADATATLVGVVQRAARSDRETFASTLADRLVDGMREFDAATAEAPAAGDAATFETGLVNEMEYITRTMESTMASVGGGGDVGKEGRTAENLALQSLTGDSIEYFVRMLAAGAMQLQSLLEDPGKAPDEALRERLAELDRNVFVPIQRLHSAAAAAALACRRVDMRRRAREAPDKDEFVPLSCEKALADINDAGARALLRALRAVSDQLKTLQRFGATARSGQAAADAYASIRSELSELVAKADALKMSYVKQLPDEEERIHKAAGAALQEDAASVRSNINALSRVDVDTRDVYAGNVASVQTTMPLFGSALLTPYYNTLPASGEAQLETAIEQFWDILHEQGYDRPRDVFEAEVKKRIKNAYDNIWGTGHGSVRASMSQTRTFAKTLRIAASKGEDERASYDDEVLAQIAKYYLRSESTQNKRAVSAILDAFTGVLRSRRGDMRSTKIIPVAQLETVLKFEEASVATRTLSTYTAAVVTNQDSYFNAVPSMRTSSQVLLGASVALLSGVRGAYDAANRNWTLMDVGYGVRTMFFDTARAPVSGLWTLMRTSEVEGFTTDYITGLLFVANLAFSKSLRASPARIISLALVDAFARYVLVSSTSSSLQAQMLLSGVHGVANSWSRLSVAAAWSWIHSGAYAFRGMFYLNNIYNATLGAFSYEVDWVFKAPMRALAVPLSATELVRGNYANFGKLFAERLRGLFPRSYDAMSTRATEAEVVGKFDPWREDDVTAYFRRRHREAGADGDAAKPGIGTDWITSDRTRRITYAALSSMIVSSMHINSGKAFVTTERVQLHVQDGAATQDIARELMSARGMRAGETPGFWEDLATRFEVLSVLGFSSGSSALSETAGKEYADEQMAMTRDVRDFIDIIIKPAPAAMLYLYQNMVAQGNATDVESIPDQALVDGFVDLGIDVEGLEDAKREARTALKLLASIEAGLSRADEQLLSEERSAAVRVGKRITDTDLNKMLFSAMAIFGGLAGQDPNIFKHGPGYRLVEKFVRLVRFAETSPYAYAVHQSEMGDLGAAFPSIGRLVALANSELSGRLLEALSPSIRHLSADDLESITVGSMLEATQRVLVTRVPMTPANPLAQEFFDRTNATLQDRMHQVVAEHTAVTELLKSLLHTEIMLRKAGKLIGLVFPEEQQGSDVPLMLSPELCKKNTDAGALKTCELIRGRLQETIPMVQALRDYLDIVQATGELSDAQIKTQQGYLSWLFTSTVNRAKRAVGDAYNAYAPWYAPSLAAVEERAVPASPQIQAEAARAVSDERVQDFVRKAVTGKNVTETYEALGRTYSQDALKYLLGSAQVPGFEAVQEMKESYRYTTPLGDSDIARIVNFKGEVQLRELEAFMASDKFQAMSLWDRQMSLLELASEGSFMKTAGFVAAPTTVGGPGGLRRARFPVVYPGGGLPKQLHATAFFAALTPDKDGRIPTESVLSVVRAYLVGMNSETPPIWLKPSSRMSIDMSYLGRFLLQAHGRGGGGGGQVSPKASLLMRLFFLFHKTKLQEAGKDASFLKDYERELMSVHILRGRVIEQDVASFAEAVQKAVRAESQRTAAEITAGEVSTRNDEKAEQGMQIIRELNDAAQDQTARSRLVEDARSGVLYYLETLVRRIMPEWMQEKGEMQIELWTYRFINAVEFAVAPVPYAILNHVYPQQPYDSGFLEADWVRGRFLTPVDRAKMLLALNRDYPVFASPDEAAAVEQRLRDELRRLEERRAIGRPTGAAERRRRRPQVPREQEPRKSGDAQEEEEETVVAPPPPSPLLSLATTHVAEVRMRMVVSFIVDRMWPKSKQASSEELWENIAVTILQHVYVAMHVRAEAARRDYERMQASPREFLREAHTRQQQQRVDEYNYRQSSLVEIAATMLREPERDVGDDELERNAAIVAHAVHTSTFAHTAVHFLREQHMLPLLDRMLEALEPGELARAPALLAIERRTRSDQMRAILVDADAVRSLTPKQATARQLVHMTHPLPQTVMERAQSAYLFELIPTLALLRRWWVARRRNGAAHDESRFGMPTRAGALDTMLRAECIEAYVTLDEARALLRDVPRAARSLALGELAGRMHAFVGTTTHEHTKRTRLTPRLGVALQLYWASLERLAQHSYAYSVPLPTLFTADHANRYPWPLRTPGVTPVAGQQAFAAAVFLALEYAVAHARPLSGAEDRRLETAAALERAQEEHFAAARARGEHSLADEYCFYARRLRLDAGAAAAAAAQDDYVLVDIPYYYLEPHPALRRQAFLEANVLRDVSEQYTVSLEKEVLRSYTVSLSRMPKQEE